MAGEDILHNCYHITNSKDRARGEKTEYVECAYMHLLDLSMEKFKDRIFTYRDDIFIHVRPI